jgi:hypothetical protein
MRYEVDTRTLRASVETVEDVLAQVERLGIADDLRPVGVAVPGGRTSATLRHVAAAWQARLGGMRWELRELGRGLAAAADGYDTVERAAGVAIARPRRDSR